MTASLMFTVPEPVDIVNQRCKQAIINLGAPLKSDSGHFITGVLTSGQNSVEVRVTWLPDPTGTQITVSAAHDGISDAELENVTLRYKYQYFHLTRRKQKFSLSKSAGSLLFLVGAAVVIVVFLFAIIKHRS